MTKYRTRLEIDPQPLVDAKRFVNKFDDVFEGTAQQAFDELQPAFLEELQTYPGESRNSRNSGEPFRWSNKPEADVNARRWWFAHFPNGRERTGDLGANMSVDLKRVAKTLQIVAGNALGYAKWAVGTFDVRRNYQLPGHARTGWQPIARTTAAFFDRFYEEFRRRFDESVPRAWGSTRSSRRNR